MTCSKCLIDKPASEFYGRRRQCKGCYKTRVADRDRLVRYGITRAEFDALLASQNEVCAICGLPGDRTLAVDHDHSTGGIRGLLCLSCNTGMGHLKDDPDLMRNAIEYLEAW